jgi:hypothetical protein
MQPPSQVGVEEGLVKVVIGLLAFVGVFAVPYGIIIAMAVVARRRGYDDMVAPELVRPPRSDWPLPCRLGLFHRWRGYRADNGRLYQRCCGCGRTRDIPMSNPW